MRKKIIVPIILISLIFLLSGCKTKTYNVTFVYENEEDTLVVKVKKGTTLSNFPEEPVKEGYNFSGWFLDDRKFEEDELILSDITLYAKFSKSSFLIQKILQAYNYHLTNTNFEVNGTGIVRATAVTSNMKYTKSRTGDDVYLFNASYGKVIIMTIDPYVEVIGNINNVIINKGKVNNELVKTKQTSSTETTYDIFSNIYGGNINSFNYLLNDETIKSIVEVGNNEYLLSLDLAKSTSDYKTYISAVNPQDNDRDKINFSKISINIKLSDDGHFDTITYHEEYSIYVKAPIIGWTDQEIKQDLRETYTYK